MMYSYCETATAGSRSLWHIRRLSGKGLCLGGGADTESLCGKKVAWDINHPISATDEFPCAKCLMAWKALSTRI